MPSHQVRRHTKYGDIPEKYTKGHRNGRRGPSRLDILHAYVSDDTFAEGFQTMRGYRNALLELIKSLTPTRSEDA